MKAVLKYTFTPKLPLHFLSCQPSFTDLPLCVNPLTVCCCCCCCVVVDVAAAVAACLAFCERGGGGGERERERES